VWQITAQRIAAYIESVGMEVIVFTPFEPGTASTSYGSRAGLLKNLRELGARVIGLFAYNGDVR
jgi:hypothetical protein